MVVNRRLIRCVLLHCRWTGHGTRHGTALRHCDRSFPWSWTDTATTSSSSTAATTSTVMIGILHGGRWPATRVRYCRPSVADWSTDTAANPGKTRLQDGVGQVQVAGTTVGRGTVENGRSSALHVQGDVIRTYEGRVELVARRGGRSRPQPRGRSRCRRAIREDDVVRWRLRGTLPQQNRRGGTCARRMVEVVVVTGSGGQTTSGYVRSTAMRTCH